MNFNTKGFFLHRVSQSIKTQSLTFFTEGQGLIQLVIFHSKKHPALVPFALYELTIQNQPKFPQSTLKNYAFLTPERYLSLDPLKLGVSYFVCDVIRKSTHPAQQDSLAFDTLLNQSQKLLECEYVFDFPHEFLMAWMKVLGINPEPLERANHFDIYEGLFSMKSQEMIGASAFNELIKGMNTQNKKVNKEAFDLMIKYLEAQVPMFNVSKTREIIHQIYH